jgi:hypothetical protein
VARLRDIETHDLGLSWVMDEAMTRTSHALADEGRVWLVDPVDVDEAIDRAQQLGEIAGVIQLLDRHDRACAALAERFGVPHHNLPSGTVPGSPLKAFRVVATPFWKEVALWWPDRRALVVSEAIGTNKMFAVGGKAAGVHFMLRALPPRSQLDGYEPDHLLVGHGAGIHGPAAAPALHEALSRSRVDLPRALVSLPFALRG